jgi:hypothetical protein
VLMMIPWLRALSRARNAKVGEMAAGALADPEADGSMGAIAQFVDDLGGLSGAIHRIRASAYDRSKAPAVCARNRRLHSKAVPFPSTTR